jgi:hypothetical protein
LAKIYGASPQVERAFAGVFDDGDESSPPFVFIIVFRRNRLRQQQRRADGDVIKRFFTLLLTPRTRELERLQWVETNPSNIRICPSDICFAA